MSKLCVLVVLVFVCVGCTNSYDHPEVKNYIDDPKNLFEDPEFGSYEKDLNAAEKKYLDKEISYSDYLDERDRLNEAYNKKIQKREKIFSQDY